MRKPSAKFEYKTFTLGEKLTEEQKEYFKKYGVIQFKKFIEPETAEIFISELAKIEKQWLEEGIEKVAWLNPEQIKEALKNSYENIKLLFEE